MHFLKAKKSQEVDFNGMEWLEGALGAVAWAAMR